MKQANYQVPLLYKYKYQGQERQDELGLNWDSFKWRNYDYAIGRFMSIDPLTETSRRISPYVYCLNNPVFFIDPDGMEAEGWGLDDDDNWIWREDINKDNYKDLGFKNYADDYSIVENCIYGDERGTAYLMTDGQWQWYNEETIASINEEIQGKIDIGNEITEANDDIQDTGEANQKSARDVELENMSVGMGLTDTVLAFFVVEVTLAYAGMSSFFMYSTEAKVLNNLVIRSDILLIGGRSGGLVKNLTGPINSVVKGSGSGERAFITDDAGRVIWDITKDRAKSVIPGRGFGPKVTPTKEQLDLLNKLWGN